MRVSLIGAGNLATNLGKALKQQTDIEVVQVFSRTMNAAETLARQLGCPAVCDLDQVCCDADAYVVSVKDAVLEEVVRTLCKGREQAVFVHTAGSMPLSVFEGCSRHYGVLYPMQTFSKEREVDFGEIPVFVEASDELAMTVVRQLARVSERVYELSSADRRYLHLAAVFACNFANHCYMLSSEVLAGCGVPFDVMLPLIDETARKVHELSPREAQTGPAVRYDENVMDAQKTLLTDGLMREIYEKMSLSIHRNTQR